MLKLKTCLLCAGLWLAATPASAQLVVTSSADNGDPGTLRAVVDAAPAGATITFDVFAFTTPTITLNTKLFIDKDLTLFGNFPQLLTISDGGAGGGAIGVQGGATVTLINLEITGVTNDGATLTLRNCHITANAFIPGAGNGNVLNFAGPNQTSILSLYHSVVRDGNGVTNKASMQGANATMFVSSTTIRQNTSRGVDNTAFSGAKATVIVNNSTIHSNNPPGTASGAGLFNSAGGQSQADMSIFNSTITFNNSGADGGGVACVASSTGLAQVVVQSSTVYLNGAAGDGGGLYTDGTEEGEVGCSFRLKNTIVAQNGSGTGSDDLAGHFLGEGYNLLTDLTGATGITPGTNGDQLVANAGLDTFSEHGGPTETWSLQPDSPAIDQGMCGPTLPYDQRGYTGGQILDTRVFDVPTVPNALGGNGCDVGAFEDQATPQTTRTLAPRLVLDGAYTTCGMMHNDLQTSGFLPTTQPFTGMPWQYEGTETLDAPGVNLSGWILLEVRTSEGPFEIYRTAGVLRTDGLVVDAGHGGDLTLSGLSAFGDFFFLIARHRNHLDVGSSIAIPLITIGGGPELVHDFTASALSAFGENAMRARDGCTFTLWGGDGTADGNTTAFDFINTWLPINGAPPGFYPGDFNLDSQGTAFDFLNVWLPANGQASNVPLPLP